MRTPAAATPATPALPGVRVGCDLVRTERLAAVLARRPDADRWLFSDAELADAVRDGVAPGSGVAVRRLAARFAAKEAVTKLLGRPPLRWPDVEVRTDETGAPSLWLRGEPTPVAVSLSHDEGVAMAVVALADGAVLPDLPHRPTPAGAAVDPAAPPATTHSTTGP